MQRRARFCFAITLLTLGYGCAGSGSPSSGSADKATGGSGPGGAVGGAGGSGAVSAFPTQNSAPPSEPTRPLDSVLVDVGGVNVAQCAGFDSTAPSMLSSSPANAHGMASPARAREALQQQKAPLPATIRSEDFLNYYLGKGSSTGLAPGEIKISAATSPVKLGDYTLPNQYDLFVAIEAGPSVSPRPPVALTLVVDTTPSMAGESLERARAGVRALGKALGAGDHLTVVTSDPALAPKQFDIQDPAVDLLGLGDDIVPQASEAGLRTAVETALAQAQGVFQAGGSNALVILSDGEGDETGVGLEQVEAAVAQGVRVHTVGVNGAFGETMLYRVARAGRGSYVHLDEQKEADVMLHGRFDQLFTVLAEGVRLEVELPWLYQLIEETHPSSAMNDVVAQDLSPGAVIPFLFRIRSCEVAFSASGPLPVTFSAVGKQKAGAEETLATLSLKASALKAQTSQEVQSMLATLAYASALKGPTADRFKLARGLLGALPQSWPTDEMSQLLELHPNAPPLP